MISASGLNQCVEASGFVIGKVIHDDDAAALKVGHALATSAFRSSVLGGALNERALDALIDDKAPSLEPLLSDEHRLTLLRIVEAGPIPTSHGVVRWQLIGLVQ